MDLLIIDDNDKDDDTQHVVHTVSEHWPPGQVDHLVRNITSQRLILFSRLTVYAEKNIKNAHHS